MSAIAVRLFLIVFVLLTLAVSLSAQAPAPVVYGQPDFTSNALNRGADASAESFNFPLGIALDADGGIYVADRENHRILYFASDGDTTADRVYGQHGSFTAHISNNNGAGNSGPSSADSLSQPTVVAYDATTGGIYVTDRDNHRVLYYADDGDTTADRVYGQFGMFNRNMTNNDGTANYGEPSADNLGTYILGVVVDMEGGLYVSDSSNHRVLYFANDGDTTADRVYGQFDNFNTGARNNDGTGRLGTPSANSLNFPRGLAVDASGGLYVADRDNNRILYFANDGDTTADRVYGQFGSLSTNAENNDGSGNTGTPSADNLSHPKGIALDAAGGLYVADTLNHRVLYFANDGDTTADWVYGQSGSFASGVSNNDGSGASGAPSADSLAGPQGIMAGPDGRVYISDTNNNRLIVIQR